MESTGYDEALRVLDEMSKVLELDKKPEKVSMEKKILGIICFVIGFITVGFSSWLLGHLVGSLIM